ncbi:hypothetical protein CLU79DRAFT_840107 [Phycomyces nitens]|nr:hypothetical protein CLU79DRAFT_840107 [Phycomyces nitens]
MEGIAVDVIPFYDGGNIGEPFVLGQEAIQGSIQDTEMGLQYSGLVGNPFVFGQGAIQGFVPQIDAPLELIDASPTVKFLGLEMNRSLGREPIKVDSPKFSGIDTGASTAGVMDDEPNSVVVAEATVEATPGFEREFDGRQETEEVNWDDYIDLND